MSCFLVATNIFLRTVEFKPCFRHHFPLLLLVDFTQAFIHCLVCSRIPYAEVLVIFSALQEYPIALLVLSHLFVRYCIFYMCLGPMAIIIIIIIIIHISYFTAVQLSLKGPTDQAPLIHCSAKHLLGCGLC